MMAPKRSEAGVSRPKQASAKTGTMQLIIVGGATVLVIVVALLLFSSGGKKSSTPKAKTAVADTTGTYGLARKPASTAARKARAGRDSLLEKRREEKRQRKQEARGVAVRTTRSPSGGYSSGGSTRAVSTPNRLRAILTDNAGTRTALVGERRLKIGDDIDGRRIVEVSGEGVKVEYRQNTYTVRVGENVY